ncbi:cupin domain-containing protein [Microbulbifer sp. CAU 1566]|uniref:cupin domain-containing protein n=1 Tax=Microbulbifer sp. CAU 1566 TaxID=2933269 RepID=UPI00200439B9|nr:cupin domain-containing protein [Microbulbifer sp. CAU 1566]MCK7598929.1 cupin domain-containing protein [Microbulbifer sp. CAU 1566]
MKIRLLYGFTLALTCSASCFGDQLLQTSTTWAGEKLAYPDGQAQITSEKLRIPAGKTSPFHCHPVPTMGYILKGDVQVETKDGNKTLLKQGESAVEVLKTLHRGTAVNGDAEIIVFYAGAEGIPTTVMAGSDSSHALCTPSVVAASS